MSCLRLVCAFALVAFSQGQTYPTTFPFENENYEAGFMDLPASAPSSGADQYTDKDVGGYIYDRILFIDSDDIVMPFALIMANFAEYALVAVFGLPPVLPTEIWNCTAKNIVFADADFTGDLGALICSVGSCCSDMIGLPKYSEDQMQWHATIKGIMESSGCPAADMLEAVYCGVVDGHYRTNCFDRLVSRTERVVTMACPDVHKLFWLECPLIKNTGMYLGMDIEPPLYDSILSPVGAINREVLVNNCDKICHPQSYYDAASSSTSTTSTTTSSAGLYTVFLVLSLMIAM